MDNKPFTYTDEQWCKISAELEGVGRKNSPGDRDGLELAAEMFIHERTNRGKGLPTPKKAREAWLKVFSAAHNLRIAIESLPSTGAADFTFLDNHSERITQWAQFLPSVERGAQFAAEYELYGIESVPNNADPVRDRFLRQTIGAWYGYGGLIRASTNPRTGEIGGPLVRFIAAVVEPIFKELGEPTPAPGVIRDAIRAHPKRVEW